MNNNLIVHIITLLELGGAQKNTLYTVEHLDRHLFKPILISGRGAFLDNDTKLLNVPVYFVRSLKRNINPFLDICAFIDIFFILRKIKPHIVHTHSSKAGIIGRWAAFFARVPHIIHTYHGFGFHEYQNPIVRFVYVWIERITAGITSRFICVSSANIEYALLKRIGNKEKFSLIHSGIALSDYTQSVPAPSSLYAELHIPAGARVITLIACFKPQKNCLDFVRIAYLLVSQHGLKNLIFMLIGDGDMRKLIEQEIKDKGLSDYFRLTGWRRDTIPLLKITKLFVLTSIHEGLPRAVVEALISGVPVVANAVDGVTEVVRDGYNGFLCTPFNIDEMAQKISEVLSNPTRYTELSQHAQQSIGSAFDINHMVSQQEELYKSVCNL